MVQTLAAVAPAFSWQLSYSCDASFRSNAQNTNSEFGVLISTRLTTTKSHKTATTHPNRALRRVCSGQSAHCWYYCGIALVHQCCVTFSPEFRRNVGVRVQVASFEYPSHRRIAPRFRSAFSLETPFRDYICSSVCRGIDGWEVPEKQA